MMATEPINTRERTCAGCGQKAPAKALVRVVLGPEAQIAVDANGGAFGRGAHVHAASACIRSAAKGGLSKAFKSPVVCEEEELAASIASAYLRRAESLVGAAKRNHGVAVGADEACRAMSSRAPLVLVAVDAGSVASRTEITAAVAEGRARAWTTKAELGRLLGRTEVAVCAVTDERLAEAIAFAVQTAQSAGTPARTGSQGAACLEDR